MGLFDPLGPLVAAGREIGREIGGEAVEGGRQLLGEVRRAGGDLFGPGMAGFEALGGAGPEVQAGRLGDPGKDPAELPAELVRDTGRVEPLDPSGRFDTSDEWIDQVRWVTDRIAELHEPYQQWRSAALQLPSDTVERLRGIDFAAMARQGGELELRGQELAAAVEPVTATGSLFGGWAGEAAVSYSEHLHRVSIGTAAVRDDLAAVGTATAELSAQLHTVIREFAVEASEQVGRAVADLDPDQLTAVITYIRHGKQWPLSLLGPGFGQHLTQLLDKFADTYEQAVAALRGLADGAAHAIQSSSTAYVAVLGQVQQEPFAGVEGGFAVPAETTTGGGASADGPTGTAPAGAQGAPPIDTPAGAAAPQGVPGDSAAGIPLSTQPASFGGGAAEPSGGIALPPGNRLAAWWDAAGLSGGPALFGSPPETTPAAAGSPTLAGTGAPQAAAAGGASLASVADTGGADEPAGASTPMAPLMGTGPLTGQQDPAGRAWTVAEDVVDSDDEQSWSRLRDVLGEDRDRGQP